MPAAAIALPAAIQGGTSLISGILGSRASKKAGQLQQEEAYRQAQGFRDVLGEYNPRIGQRADQAATDVLAASGAGGDEARQAAATGGARVRADTLSANELLDPYVRMGAEGATSLREFMAPGGAGSKTFTAADMAAYDPGYQFRLDEAAKAVQSSAAARGGALGGGALKALQQRSQDVASSEFGAASERFRAQQQDRFSRLFGATQLGGQYAGQAGKNLIDAGRYEGDLGMRGAEFAGDLGFRGAQSAGQFGTRGTEMMAGNAFDTQRSVSDLMTGGAAAKAAGTVGSANAWGGALGGIGNAAIWAGSQYQKQQQDEEDRKVMSQWMNPALTSLPPGYDPGSYRPPDWTVPTSVAPELPPYVQPYPKR